MRIDNASVLQNPEIKESMHLGKFSIADVASQAIVQSVIDNSLEANNMLEFCAGKGSKTLMFQSLANQR